MGILYLINKPYGENGLEIAKMQAKKDENIAIVLIMNGVYYTIEEDALRELKVKGVKIYAIEEDVRRRGLEDKIKDVKMIDYPQLIDLIVENKVVNFA
jgi:sulfur relay protein TusB/DsrH